MIVSPGFSAPELYASHRICAAMRSLIEPVMFIARMIAIVLPAVENFNIETALVTGRMVPPDYIGWTALYTAAYGTMAILLAFMLFEDRDLA